MDIGILTMHRVMNYGSFMQAFALKRIVEGLGHRVSFRDFNKGSPRHSGAKVEIPGLGYKLARLPGMLADVNGFVKKRRYRQRYAACFREVCWPLLGVTSKRNCGLAADAMVIGSDEVFNYTQNHAFGYVPCLFGHGIDAARIISYAASAGYADWEDVVRDEMQLELGAGLSRLQHIAVRDENTRRLVEGCTGRTPTLVLDPTLIYAFDEHIPPGERNVNQPYLLVYAYEGRMDSPAEIDAVRACAARKGLRIVSAGGYHEWCDDNIVVTPFELLSLFRDAAGVVTDTFHGSIFSMLQGNTFATFIRGDNPMGSNANKVRHLLEQCGMEGRIVNHPVGLDSVLDVPPDYDRWRERMAPLREQSLAFLRSALA